MIKALTELISQKLSCKAFLLLGLSFIIVVIVSSEKTLDPDLMPRFTALAISILVFSILLLLDVKKHGDQYDFSIFKRAIIPIYGSYIVIVGLSIIWATNYSEAVVEFSKSFVLFLYLLMLSIFLTKKPEFTSHITKIIVVFLLIILAMGLFRLAQIILAGELNLAAIYTIGGSFSHRNIYSHILLLCLPFSVYGIYRFNSMWRYLCVLACILAFALITILMTRSVWVGLLVASIFSLLLYLLLIRKPSVSGSIPKRIYIYILLFIIIIIVTVLLYSMVDSFDTFIYQFNEALNFKEGNTYVRFVLWRSSLDMISENPFIGVGANNWKILFPKYGGVDELSEAGRVLPIRPHNDFIWVMSETGPLGLFLYLAIYIIIFYYIFYIIKNTENMNDRLFALGLLFAVTSYFVVSCFSFPKERIETSIFLNLLIALVLIKYHQISRNRHAVGKHTIRIISIPVILLLLFSIFVGLKKVNSEIHMKEAYNCWRYNDYKCTIEEIDKAYNQFSTVDLSGNPLLLVRAMASYQMRDFENAFKDSKAAYDDSPYSYTNLNMLGVLYILNNDYINAENKFREAIKIFPTYNDALINLSKLLIKSKRYDEAYETIKSVSVDIKKSAYLETLLEILKIKIDRLTKSLEDEIIINTIVRKQSSNDWILRTYKKAKRDNNSFEDQLIIRAIYILENVNGVISSAEATAFRKKYSVKTRITE